MNDKYVAVVRALEKEKFEREKAQDLLVRERMAYRMRIAHVSEQAEEAAQAHGCNTVQKKNFRGYDHANLANIKTFLKMKVLPHIKFFHHSWTRYAPDDPKSFYRKIIGELDMPEDCLQSLEWRDRQVPLIAKCKTNWRSNVNNGARTQYMSEYEYLCS